MLFRPLITPVVLAALAACAGQNGEAAPDRTADTDSITEAAADTAPSRSGGVTDPSPAPADERVDPGDRDGWTEGVTEADRTISGTATIRAVRIAAHEGYDRVVVELGGAELPGYRIERLAGPAIRCGSGFVVEMEGEDLIQITLEPARAHTDAGEPTLVDRRWPVRLPVVSEVVLTCDFEGQVVLVAGVNAGSRYRVLELRDPARLVVDVTPG